jgi:hypothetical protein
MSRESMNLTEEQYAQLVARQGMPKLYPQPQPGVTIKVTRGVPGSAKMNRWEQEYAMELEARRRAGEILWYGFEAIKLRLTGGTFYTPDFCTVGLYSEVRKSAWSHDETHVQMTPISFIEVKGHLRDDANVKFKVAAELFPFAEFFMYRKRKAKEGGGWELMKHLNGAAR